MAWRAIKSIVVAATCWAAVTHLEDVARYVRMREMSNPKHRPPR